jgi:hypothetical protein
MGKRNLVLYIDDNLISLARSKGWNLSELFNNMLNSMVDNDNDNEKVNQIEINNKILEHQTEINRLKAIKLEKEKHKGLVIEYDGT